MAMQGLALGFGLVLWAASTLGSPARGETGATPEQVVESQLDAYNRHDLEAFLKTYAEDIVIADVGGEVTLRGKAALRERYAALFANFPQNHAEIRHRVIIGNRVADHEFVTRKAGMTFDAVAIYMVQDGFIQRVDFLK
jgi:uncharacterized protein (TIGR02246 family)